LAAILLTFWSCLFGVVLVANAANAPPWLRALQNTPLPEHDDKTNAVLLYSEDTVTVVSADKVKEHVRAAFKILRPGGRDYGIVAVPLNAHKKVSGLHGWCIPQQGKDYEVGDKDASERAPRSIEYGEFMTDLKYKVLEIPARDAGNLVGYEYDTEEQPMLLQDEWLFQQEIPAVEQHYSLILPSQWEYRALWLNHPEIQPAQSGSNQWQWTVRNVPGIREETDMPPMTGVAGQMIISFFPPGGPGQKGFANWQQMGTWYLDLTQGRRDPSPELKQAVTSLTAASPTTLAKMQAIANFAQHDIRYVAIEFGIGGWQPHAASEVYTHRYGDCKDKATLMSAMLHEIGVDSYYVIINSRRGAVSSSSAAHVSGFNHAILAIKLPEGLKDSTLIALRNDPKLGALLFFDPTNDLTPFGQISGHLQENYGLLVTPDGGQLIDLPKQPAAMNGVKRNGKLTLDSSGTLTGEVQEVRIGDRALTERRALLTTTNTSDQIKPIEVLLADSLPTFHIVKASVINLHQNDQPFGFNYSFEARNYSKTSGDLLLVRPRVLGSKAQGFLETKDPRKFPIEFPGPALDTDIFEITVPAGYVVDGLPDPVDADYNFGSYHSKTEVSGPVIRYTRSYEIKELSVAAANAEEVRKFNRIIASDERSVVMLKPGVK
jgi:transglutaminase-like putative cysteine protease